MCEQKNALTEFWKNPKFVISVKVKFSFSRKTVTPDDSEDQLCERGTLLLSLCDYPSVEKFTPQ